MNKFKTDTDIIIESLKKIKDERWNIEPIDKKRIDEVIQYMRKQDNEIAYYIGKIDGLETLLVLFSEGKAVPKTYARAYQRGADDE